MPREAGDVHLVDHGRGKGPAQRRVALPIVRGGVDHDALHRDSHRSARIGSPLWREYPSGTTTARP